MLFKDLKQKKFVYMGIITLAVLFFIILSIFLIIKYSVEGETKMPFELSKISVISTAESDIKQNENKTWEGDIVQKNDIFLYIEKNSNYKKDEIIKNVKINNFQILQDSKIGDIKIYRPSRINNGYTYEEEFLVSSEIEYKGAKETNTEILAISNQGGLIGLSIYVDNIGKCKFNENERIQSDGRLIKRAEIDVQDIQFKISFDLIIELESGKSFKTNIVLDLPSDGMIENGVSQINIEKNDIVFKRI